MKLERNVTTFTITLTKNSPDENTKKSIGYQEPISEEEFKILQ